jgi:thiol-disulfide isomerase/thioredoxin
MRIARRVVAGTAALTVAATLSACSTLGGATGSGSGELSYVAGDGSTVLVAASDREAPVDFSGTTLEGGTWSLADHRGKVVVVNVWASWCPPCRAEAPALQRTATELADEDVVFVGVNIRDSRTAAAAFVERFGLTYPTVVDQSGAGLLAFRGPLAAVSVPTTLVVDREGRVAARALSEVDGSRLKGLVEPLLAEGGGTPSAASPSAASPSAASPSASAAGATP